MKQIIINIGQQSSQKIDFASLIVSVRETYGSHCEIVVGCPGQQNVVKDVKVGDAVLFESPSDGILEVRVLTMNSDLSGDTSLNA